MDYKCNYFLQKDQINKKHGVAVSKNGGLKRQPTIKYMCSKVGHLVTMT